MALIYYFVLFALGLVLGSFANVCIARLPNDESLLLPASHCPQCNQTLHWRHNIPILSFLFLNGRCAFCQKKISWRYPSIEFLMSIAFVLLGHRYAHTVSLLFLSLFLAFVFITISVIDFQTRIIPDELSLGLVGGGFIFSHWNPFLMGSWIPPILLSALWTIIGGLLMLGIAWLGEKLFHQEALGGGDIKLVAGIGACLGGVGLYGTLFIGSLVGGIFGLVLMGLRKKKKGDTIPFGPFLCLGAFLTFMYPLFLKGILFP